MPRTARKLSKTGLYHIIIRGVNKETIFIDDEDRKMFLRLLKKYKIEFKCNVYAYCLMSNHIHLVINVDSCNLSKNFCNSIIGITVSSAIFLPPIRT